MILVDTHTQIGVMIAFTVTIKTTKKTDHRIAEIKQKTTHKNMY